MRLISGNPPSENTKTILSKCSTGRLLKLTANKTADVEEPLQYLQPFHPSITLSVSTVHSLEPSKGPRKNGNSDAIH